jgi:hypothetical protein
MAKIELPSGAWVEYRDQLKALDKFVVQDAVFLNIKDGGVSQALGFQNDIRNALLGRIITNWSYNAPTPAGAKDIAAADVIIGEAMEIDDYNALAEAVQPLVDKVSGNKSKDKDKEEDPKKPLDS